jgi:hypothetical protein
MISIHAQGTHAIGPTSFQNYSISYQEIDVNSCYATVSTVGPLTTQELSTTVTLLASTNAMTSIHLLTSSMATTLQTQQSPISTATLTPSS